MKTHRSLRGRRLALLAGVTSLAIVAVLLLRSRPIARAPVHALAPAALQSPRSVRVCWAEYADNRASGQVATAGLTRLATWNITISGLLVRHPRGDLVIDAGNSQSFRREIADYPLFSRLWLELIPGSNRTIRSAPDALRALGAEPDRLFGVLLSHAHVDHAGGLVDLPRVPVLMPEEEIDFFAARAHVQTIDVVPAHARAVLGRATPLRFTGGPYETFDESADVFGDGSIVVVKLPGHTPGSIGTFVNVSPTLRLFHVGDAVNVVEAVERRLTKSVVMRSTDLDGAEADRSVARIARLHEANPSITILPAHDRDAWEKALGAPGRCTGE